MHVIASSVSCKVEKKTSNGFEWNDEKRERKVFKLKILLKPAILF